MTDQTERRFSVKAVSITRGYSADTPFKANISVENRYGDEIKVNLPEDRVQKLIEHVSDLVLQALTEQFTNMAEDHKLALEEQAQKALPPAIEAQAESTPA